MTSPMGSIVVVISVERPMRSSFIDGAVDELPGWNVAAKVVDREAGDPEHDPDEVLPISWVSPWTTPITTRRVWPGMLLDVRLQESSPAYRASAASSNSGTNIPLRRTAFRPG